MKAIVFGASGTVGRALWRCLEHHGWDLYGTRAGPSSRSLVSFDLSRDDLSRLPFQVRGARVAFICAAISGIDVCKRDPARTRSVNVDGTLRLAMQLAAEGVRPVFYSSDYVFSGAVGGYAESDTADPITEYGRQKKDVETGLESLGVGALVLRLGKVLSSDPAAPGLLGDWYRSIRLGQPVFCAADQWFCPVSDEDVAEASRKLVEQSAAGLFHVAQRTKYRRLELLGEFVERLQIRDVRVQEGETCRLGFADARGLDVSLVPGRLEAALGRSLEPVGRCMDRFGEALKTHE